MRLGLLAGLARRRPPPEARDLPTIISGRRCKPPVKPSKPRKNRPKPDLPKHVLFPLFLLEFKGTELGHDAEYERMHKMQGIQINSSTVEFLKGSPYAWVAPRLAFIVEQARHTGAIITDGRNDEHRHAYTRNRKFEFLETRESVSQGENERHAPPHVVDPKDARVVDSALKIVEEMLEGADELTSMPDEGDVEAYYAEITSCEVKGEKLCVKLDTDKKYTSAREFLESESKLGLWYKDDKVEYVAVKCGRPRCFKIDGVLKAMGR